MYYGGDGNASCGAITFTGETCDDSRRSVHSILIDLPLLSPDPPVYCGLHESDYGEYCLRDIRCIAKDPYSKHGLSGGASRKAQTASDSS